MLKASALTCILYMALSRCINTNMALISEKSHMLVNPNAVVTYFTIFIPPVVYELGEPYWTSNLAVKLVRLQDKLPSNRTIGHCKINGLITIT